MGYTIVLGSGFTRKNVAILCLEIRKKLGLRLYSLLLLRIYIVIHPERKCFWNNNNMYDHYIFY